MINRMKYIDPTVRFFAVRDEISIPNINNNVSNTTNNDIKYITDTPGSLTVRSCCYVFYILTQALSKLLDKPLHLTMRAVSPPDSEILEALENHNKFGNNINDYCISAIYISKSSFNRSSVNNWRNGKAPTNKELDNMLNQLIPEGPIFGMTKYKNKLVFFIDKMQYADELLEYTLLALAYRFFVPSVTDAHPEVHAVFRTLLESVNNYHQHKDITEFFTGVTNAYKTYLPTCKEYMVDKAEQLAHLIKSMKERNLHTYKLDVESKRLTMNAKLEQLETAVKAYKDANILYTSLLNSSDDEHSLVTLREIQDLLSRSKAIKEYNINKEGITFTIVQPIYVNSKEDFERILSRKPQENSIKLLREALIEEKYKIYTYADISINLVRNRIERDNGETTADNLDALPNPHIMGFSCFGQYTGIIGSLITEGKYLEALEEAFEAAAGLNWADNPVVSRIIEDIETWDYISFIEDSNGNRISFNEYERRLNETVSSETETTATVNNTTGEVENGPAGTTVV